MIIAVDIGNSAAKAALVEGSSALGAGRLDTSIASGADLLDGLRVLAGSTDEPPSAIMAVSVVDRWTERLERAAEALELDLTVIAASHIPISTALVRPDQAGPDRLLAAWAAAKLYGSPIIVVDLGTATTVDAVDADGFFLGGAIVPGLALAADALAEGTARLPRVELGLPADAIGEDTSSAIQSGIVIGHIGAVRELATRMHARINAAPAGGNASAAGKKATAAGGNATAADGHERAPTRVVVTGGHASAAWAEQAWRRPATAELPAIADELDPDLVLRGIGMLAEQMAGRPHPEPTSTVQSAP